MWQGYFYRPINDSLFKEAIMRPTQKDNKKETEANQIKIKSVRQIKFGALFTENDPRSRTTQPRDSESQIEPQKVPFSLCSPSTWCN